MASPSLPRFHLPADLWRPRMDCPLPESEARHATSVLRLQPADAVIVFDGQGRHAVARLGKPARRFATVQLPDPDSWVMTAPPSPHLVLAAVLTKQKAWDWMLTKATELGVNAIQPLTSDHCVVRPDPSAAARTAKRDRWGLDLVEAAKQCGATHLPMLHPVIPLDLWMQQPVPGIMLRLWASLEPDARPLPSVLETFASPDLQAQGVALLIGPEGDFSVREQALLRAAGIPPVRLGPLTMRAETAALAGLAIVRSLLDRPTG
jgi:16S rRNA (uracil1498-N3)-methyltransferase